MTEENLNIKDILQKQQEKLKFLLRKLEKIEEKQKKLETCIKIFETKNFEKMYDDVHDLDIRLKSVEIYQKDQDQNWKSIINFVVQIIWVIMAAYILFKLGLQPPV